MIYVCIVLLILLSISIFYCIRFALTILRFQDSLGEALDVINERYGSIASICERPLFYDSPEVKKVLEDVKDTRAALHSIAYSLTSNFDPQEEENEGP